MFVVCDVEVFFIVLSFGYGALSVWFERLAYVCVPVGLNAWLAGRFETIYNQVACLCALLILFVLFLLCLSSVDAVGM